MAYLFIAHQSLQNKHAHFYSNGMVIHSHPLDNHEDDPINSHHHSKTEICFYQIINFDYFSIADELHIEADALTFPKTFESFPEKSFSDLWIQNKETRGPPYL